MSSSIRADFGGTLGGVSTGESTVIEDFFLGAILCGVGPVLDGITRGAKFFGERRPFGEPDLVLRRRPMLSFVFVAASAELVSTLSSKTGPTLVSPDTFLRQLWYPGALADLS